MEVNHEKLLSFCCGDHQSLVLPVALTPHQSLIILLYNFVYCVGPFWPCHSHTDSNQRSITGYVSVRGRVGASLGQVASLREAFLSHEVPLRDLRLSRIPYCKLLSDRLAARLHLLHCKGPNSSAPTGRPHHPNHILFMIYKVTIFNLSP